MFVVFTVWAAFGLAFPAKPLPLALNVISKILCFVSTIMLFVWREDEVTDVITPDRHDREPLTSRASDQLCRIAS